MRNLTPAKNNSFYARDSSQQKQMLDSSNKKTTRSIARGMPIIVTSEVRKPTPTRQYSPTKYVIHNPPQQMRFSPQKYQNQNYQTNQSSVINSKELEQQWKNKVDELQNKLNFYEQNKKQESPVKHLQGEETKYQQEQVQQLLRQKEQYESVIAQYERSFQQWPQQNGQQLNNSQDVQENGKLKQELQELQQLFNEKVSSLQELQRQLEQLNVNVNEMGETMKNQEQYQVQIDEEKRMKELEIEELKQQVQQTQDELGEQETSLEQFQTEVNTWKKKQEFIELNKEHHQNQEKLLLAQGEMSNIKQRQAKSARLSEVSDRSGKK